MKNRNQCEDGLVGVSAMQMTYFQPYRPGESNGDWQRRTGEEGVGTSTLRRPREEDFNPNGASEREGSPQPCAAATPGRWPGDGVPLHR